MKIKHGSTRTVFLVGKLAIKIPSLRSWRNFLQGLLSNMQEVSFDKMKDGRLCPILYSTIGGFVLVMKRATPLTEDDWYSFDADNFISYDLPVENKIDSFGKVDGKIISVDYGS